MRPVTTGHQRSNYGIPGFFTWAGLFPRCYNERSRFFYRYGGRGIRVCERWHTFANFLADMGEKPDGKTLDRIDNDGDYEPGNCRWATAIEQRENRSDKFRDLTGGTFGYLAVMARVSSKTPSVKWICRCICGTEKIVSGSNLVPTERVTRLTRSCGCLGKRMKAWAHYARLGTLRKATVDI